MRIVIQSDVFLIETISSQWLYISFIYASWGFGVLGSCCDTSVLSTNRRKHPFYIHEIYIKPCVSVG